MLLHCLLAQIVSEKKSASPLSLLLCVHLFFSVCFKMFSVSLVLTYLILMCFGIISSMFLMLGVHWASWICGFILFTNFGKFSLIISSNISPLLPLFPHFWRLQLRIYHTCVSYIHTLASHLTNQMCICLLAKERAGGGDLDLSFCYKHVPPLFSERC